MANVLVVQSSGSGGSETFATNETGLAALTPTHFDGGYVASQGTALLSAEALVVATGQAMSKGVYDMPAHGLTVGEEYVTDPNTLGNIILRSALAAGEPYQKLFTVPNADQISVDVQPLIDSSASGADTSEIFKTVSNWSVNSSTGVAMAEPVEEVRHGKHVAVVSDAITNGWQYLSLGSNLPLTRAQDVLIEVEKQAAGSAIGFRVGRPGFVRDVVIDGDTGAVNTVDADVQVLGVIDSGNFLEIRLRYQPNATYTSWQIYPAYSTTGSAASQQGATGELAISRLEMNFPSKEVPTGNIYEGAEVDAAPAWEGSANMPSTISTGVDLNTVDRLIFHFKRTNDTWPAEYALSTADILLGIPQGYMIHHYNDDFISIENMSPVDFANGDIPMSFGGGINMTVTKIEFKVRATGLSPIDDQSASGYVDVGSMRIQWGTGVIGGSTVTLPALFADDQYSVVTQNTFSAPRYTQVISKTATSFDLQTYTLAGGSSSTPSDWQAVGLKP